MSKVVQKKRRIAGILMALFLTSSLLCAAFVVSHAKHHCTGAGCPICAQIHFCSVQLYQQGEATDFGKNTTPSKFQLCLAILPLLMVLRFLCRLSLTGLKIRLNN